MIAKLKYTILALLGFIPLRAQVNLVPNPSFEENLGLPCYSGAIDKCKYWFNPGGGGGSPDYYSRLASSTPPCGSSLPINTLGYQDTFEGDFYIGIFTYNKYILNSGTEYISVKLSEPLLPKLYKVAYYVSLADSLSAYSLNNIGVCFTEDSLHEPTGTRITNHIPQYVNPNSNPLTNKLGWTKVSGEFIASGGERFLTIGNFNLSENDDTVFVGGQSSSWPEYASYIYIDSVSVMLSNDVGVDEKPMDIINIYPSHAQDFVSIELSQSCPQAQLSIYNLTGQLIAQKQIIGNQQIPISELGNGIYIFVIQNGDKVIGRQRVVVAR